MAHDLLDFLGESFLLAAGFDSREQGRLPYQFVQNLFLTLLEDLLGNLPFLLISDNASDIDIDNSSRSFFKRSSIHGYSNASSYRSR